MKRDPILEELWGVKDKLAAEAGYDVDRFLQNLRAWEASHPHAGRVIRTAEELRQMVEEAEGDRAKLSLKEERTRQKPDSK